MLTVKQGVRSVWTPRLSQINKEFLNYIRRIPGLDELSYEEIMLLGAVLASSLLAELELMYGLSAVHKEKV